MVSIQFEFLKFDIKCTDHVNKVHFFSSSLIISERGAKTENVITADLYYNS